MAQLLRVVTITGDGVISAGANGRTGFQPTPAGCLESLGTLASRVAARTAGGEGVIVLTDPAVLVALGLPTEAPAEAKRADHPAVESVRRAGWKLSGLREHMTIWAPDRPVLHVHVQPWGSGPWAPGVDVLSWTRMLARFHTVTGAAWHTSPGTTGVGMMRDRHAARTVPFWRPDWSQCPPANSAAELPWNVWDAAEVPDRGFRQRWDAGAQYLAAAGNAELAAVELARTGARKFAPGLYGYWQIERPAWNDARLPHPDGKGPGVPVGTPIWVTTPTMALLTELAGDGWLGMGPVLDSWTAGAVPDRDQLGRPRGSKGAWVRPAGGRLLKGWAEALRDARATLAISNVEEDQAVLAMVKAVYTEAIGCLVRPTMRVYRPDWHHTIVGLARCNLWRKMWAAGQAGRWPLAIRTDAVTYHTHTPEPDPPAGFKVAREPDGKLSTFARLGEFAFKGGEAIRPPAPPARRGRKVAV